MMWAEQTIQGQFARFHAENPEVYDELVRLACRARRRGHRKVGIKMLWEVMRWNLLIETNDPSGAGYKLNNNYPSRYARLIMACEPDLDGMFDVRELRS